MEFPGAASSLARGSLVLGAIVPAERRLAEWLPMRLSCALLLASGLLTGGLCLVSGCGPAVPKGELGKVLDHVPRLPGIDEKYELRYVPPNPEAVRKNKAPPPPSHKKST